MYKQYAFDCSKNETQLYPLMHYCTQNNANCKNLNPFQNPNSCFCALFNLLTPRLLVYKVKYNHKNLEFIRPSSANTYIVPTIALEEADVFFGYGIYNDIKFETITSKLYNKRTYAYDCGIDDIEIDSPLVTFKSECIGTDKFILNGQNSSGKIHTFGQKIKQLNLEHKKYFIKMDIAGAESEIIEDLLKYSNHITGISIVIRLEDNKKFEKLLNLLPLLEKDFVLVYRNLLSHECTTNNKCKYLHENLAKPIALTYINKNLVDEKYLPFKQDFSDEKMYSSPLQAKTYIPKYTINWRIVLYEKIKNFINQFHNT
ncbi:hypothetical protein IJG14_00395 [bacterium]|nr:hypothetical protein [bacterium]